MIKVPQNNKFNVSSGSDFVPNIAYTKNVHFDDSGRITQSKPFVRIYDNSQSASFGTVAEIIQKGNAYEYKVFTDSKIFDLDIDDLSCTVDATAPDGDATSRFAGYNSTSVLVNTSSDIYQYRPDTDAFTQRNTDNETYLCEFPSRGTWVGASLDSVEQYDSATLDDSPLSTTSVGPDLQLPTYFRITGLAYSNYKIGVATRHEMESKAMFFTWDGTSASASTGTPVDAASILGLIAYRSSWVVLTSRGELLYFNGGGWDVLGRFPAKIFDAIWMDESRDVDLGNFMYSDGEKIYILVGTWLFSDEIDSGVLPYFYSGVWCFDPTVGLYHRQGMTYSKIRRETLTATAGVYTAASAHYLETGDLVTLDDLFYYAIKINSTTFKLATSYDLAIAGTNDMTDNATFKWIERKDYSQLLFNSENFGVLKRIRNYITFGDLGFTPYFSSAMLNTPALGIEETLCIEAVYFDNISSVIYSKALSQELNDVFNSINVKHKKLENGEKIIIKYKIKDNNKIKAIGEAGDVTPENYITWSNATTFTFTKTGNRFLDIDDIEVGDEVEILSGAAAGQTAHIVSVTDNGTTYTVVVDENLRGAESGVKSVVMFDKFQKLTTITRDNSDGLFTAALNKSARWIQVKLELRGTDVTIEEMIINNKTHKPVV